MYGEMVCKSSRKIISPSHLTLPMQKDKHNFLDKTSKFRWIENATLRYALSQHLKNQRKSNININNCRSVRWKSAVRRILNARIGLVEDGEVCFEKGSADTAACRRVCGLKGTGADYVIGMLVEATGV